MKFFFFKKKSLEPAKKNGTSADRQQQKRKTIANFSNSATHHPITAASAQGQSGNNKRTHSPSHSISSASTQSSLHTVQHAQKEETRGIFRTLEPVWSYLPNQLNDQWVPLDNGNQHVLELAFNAKQQSECTISLNHHPLTPTNGAPAAVSKTNVYFYSNKSTLPANASPKKKRRPATHFFTPSSSSSPSFTNHPQQMKSSPNLAAYQQPHIKIPSNSPLPSMPSSPTPPSIKDGLYLHQNLRRALVPYWWFEQDNEHGGKGMCRFDHKNQVRLEALSEDRSTLTLTDASFPVPFQIILEHTDRSLREECCGFMYLNTSLVPAPSSIHALDPFFLPNKDAAVDADLHHNDILLNRRCSI
ncbi:hypothetical protein BCR42DRAFT_409768 [Absidia repens]|uniref:WWE domain-containing protein n=1 Tax=Absidia repens TaxID=90262 RepID=A0A1X2IN37_9FUNG|nr:hypothetical protein BCR42DRAFT_409768 [Absidia repens]